MSDVPDRPTVLDTSVLSNFAHVDGVELLEGLSRVATVARVESELEAGTQTHPYLEDALWVLGDGIPVVTPGTASRRIEAELVETVDPGEAQVIAVAEAANGTVVTDDWDARTTASQRGVTVTGSIGLLVRFVERGLVRTDAADQWLKRWIDEAGFRSPARDIDVFLEE